MFGQQVNQVSATRVGRRPLRAGSALALAVLAMVVGTGVVSAATYRTTTFRSYYGGTAYTTIITGTGSIQIQPSMTDEGYSQKLAVRLWIKDASTWRPVGDWRYATTRDWTGITGASTYWTYGPIRATGTYCFWMYYSWLRSSGWVGANQNLGCYTI